MTYLDKFTISRIVYRVGNKIIKHLPYALGVCCCKAFALQLGDDSVIGIKLREPRPYILYHILRAELLFLIFLMLLLSGGSDKVGD